MTELEGLFGPGGALFLEHVAAARSIHPLAVGMTVLAATAPLSNGAQIRLWAEPSPLCIATILVNPPQSRKSQTTTLVREIGLVLDRFAHDRERATMDPDDTEQLPSCVLEGFTPEAR